MLKNLLKQSVKKTILGLTDFRIGRYLYEQLLNASMGINIHVKHGEVMMVFASPNSITRYRSESFASKEPETLSWLESFPEGSVLWDVGANVGLYSVYAAKRNNVCVFAFEPSVFNLELLARNIFNNDLQGRIIIVPVALSDIKGNNPLKMTSTCWGGALSTFGKDFDQHGNKLNSIFEFQTIGITMDEAHYCLTIPRPQFIKIDVDGIEHLILRGGNDILKNVESVMIEIDDDFTEQAEEAARHLKRAGLILLSKNGGNAGNQYNQLWIRERI